MKPQTKKFLITQKFSIKQAMKHMNKVGYKAVFVVNRQGKLLGSLSDGDIRKWIIGGGSLRNSVEAAFNRKPKTVNENYRIEEVKHIMFEMLMEYIPVVNGKREVVEILTWDDVFSDTVPRQKKKIDAQVVIMAGGKGSRLEPFTKILPKSLIPIGDKPIIEIIMDKFNEHGINNFFVSVNHKSRMIKAYFDDTNSKYNISYIEEPKPLGTAGSLKLLKDKVKGPFIVTNCDIIIEADCAELVKFHRENANDMTIVVSCRHYRIPYGVCEIENGGFLKDLHEKPEYDLLVNTGMYVMEERLLDLITPKKVFHIDDLINKAKHKKYRIGVFPINENSWIDTGQWEEYHKAIEKMRAQS